jgi:hypothetical protein
MLMSIYTNLLTIYQIQIKMRNHTSMKTMVIPPTKLILTDAECIQAS